MYELAIIGGGPAGVSAAVYAARKKLKTIFITESFGGQSFDSLDIQNWIGTPHISGNQFGEILEKHIREYASDTVELKLGARAEKITKIEGGYEVSVGSEIYKTKTILLATGSSRRKLDIPGGKEFENKGIVYCASCDGPLFAGKNVAVIGGGNAGFETAAQLLAYCPSVTLMSHGDKFKADELTVETISKNPNFKSIFNSEPVEIKGDKFVNALVYKNIKTGEVSEIAVDGVFVEIGLIPNTSLIGDLVEKNQHQQIKIDPRTQKTSASGIWAAGDNTDVLYHQNNIAAGDGVRALEDIYMYLRAENH
ncbi:MAG: FAD-dependent oxidoreductase [Minisyncoccia bacterium]